MTTDRSTTTASAAGPAGFTTTWDQGVWCLLATGPWDLDGLASVQAEIKAIAGPGSSPVPATGEPASVRVDLSDVSALDTVGALLLHQMCARMQAAGHRIQVVGVPQHHRGLLDVVWRAAGAPPPPPPPASSWHNDRLVHVGRSLVDRWVKTLQLLAFFGVVCIALGRVLANPRRIRLAPLFYHLDHAGLRALPILGLLAFLIGIVMGYQGIVQLGKVGAEFLVTDLLGIGILREIGSLITAIIVAGRSGSAFTAQIGTMQVTQEVDAMRTMGLDPLELLVIPRLLALIVALPLLTFFANVIALFGGAVMTYVLFDMNFLEFFSGIPGGALDVHDATLGLIKAPLFAFVIAMVGCHEGLQVSGSAESVGLHTTRSVVEAIFLVMVINALVSVIATALGI